MTELAELRTTSYNAKTSFSEAELCEVSKCFSSAKSVQSTSTKPHLKLALSGADNHVLFLYHDKLKQSGAVLQKAVDKVATQFW